MVFKLAHNHKVRTNPLISPFIWVEQELMSLSSAMSRG
jgi:hypothetical protein